MLKAHLKQKGGEAFSLEKFMKRLNTQIFSLCVVHKVDADNSSILKETGVGSIPTILVYKDGERKRRTSQSHHSDHQRPNVFHVT